MYINFVICGMLGVWGGNLGNMHLGKKLICWELWEDCVAPFWGLRKKEGNLLVVSMLELFLSKKTQCICGVNVGLQEKIKIIDVKWDNDSPKKGCPKRTSWPNVQSYFTFLYYRPIDQI
jgi:hypothetical protein